jgi:2,4-dienoyl-CoA reductase (NADPH2)
MSHKGAGVNLRLAALMKKAVSIPIITVGRLNPRLGEQALRDGAADFIAMTRRLTADHDYVNKLAAGRLEDIVPCTGCCNCTKPAPKLCMVNAALGKEYEYEIRQAEKRKKVLVVGGGPAGMEAARVAALRGHDVTLYEKTHRLGGLIPVAALVKGFEFEDFLSLRDYLATQIKKLGVTTRLGQEVDASIVRQVKPDVVIVATGGAPTAPNIPGIDKPLVVSASVLHRKLKFYLRFLGPKLLERLTRLWLPVGKRVVIMGGGIHGCELAEFFAKRGRQVTIVSTGTEDALGQGMPPFRIEQLLQWFEAKGIITKTEAVYVEIADEGLIIINKEGKKEMIQADSIVPAMPLSPNADLLKSVEGKVREAYAIGDCDEPKLLTEAIAAGSRIGRTI